MQVYNARIAVAVFFVALLPLASPTHAVAEGPVLARPESAGPPTGPRGHGHHRHLKPFLHPGGDESLLRSKVETLLSAPSILTASPAPGTSTVVTGFDGIDESSQFADPPDGALAVSGTYMVEAVNDGLSVWRKSYDPTTGQLSTVTNLVNALDLNGFLGNNANCYTGTNDFFGLVSDPSLDYDVAHDRFFLSMISFDQLFGTSSLCVAVTLTGDPSGYWYIYAFPISPASSLLDFPRGVVGADGVIYITGNLFLFDASGNAVFDQARVYALKTADMYLGNNTTPKIVAAGKDPQTGMLADSLSPARGTGVAGMYFVSASNPGSGALGSAVTLWKWSNPFGTSVFTQQGYVTVASYAQPPQALQPGALPAGVTNCTQSGANCIQTNDARNLTTYWSSGTVWAAHNIGCTQEAGPAACAQWYQLGNLDGSPALLLQGVVDNPAVPGRFRYFPSVAVDQNGSVALNYAYSSSAEYPGIASTAIVAGTPSTETVLKAGEGTFVSTRYGDYAATTVDPHDNLTVWHLEEYAKLPSPNTEWGTWVAAIQIGAAPTIGDFSVAAALDPASPPAVLPGGAQTYDVTVSALGGFTGSVSLSLSGLPSGASGSISPNPVAFTAGGATAAASVLTITTGATTPGGTYTVTITATGGGITHSATVTVTVQDFSISVSPSSQSVTRGGSTRYVVTVNAINGFSGAVAFTSLSGVPSGVTYSPRPLPSSVGPGASFTLTLSTSGTTRRATYTLTITAKSGSVTHRATFQLSVQ